MMLSSISFLITYTNKKGVLYMPSNSIPTLYPILPQHHNHFADNLGFRVCILTQIEFGSRVPGNLVPGASVAIKKVAIRSVDIPFKYILLLALPVRAEHLL